MKECPRAGEPDHSPLPEEPDTVAAWHEWAEEKTKTHEQSLCGSCGRYAIWRPRA